MQAPGQFKPALGVIYCTTMSRPDAALALAMLHGFEGKREARVGAVAVTDAGLETAVYCDLVGRFYQVSGPPPNTNRTLPIGLATDAGALPPDPPMIKPAVERRNEKGEPAYVRSIRRVSDTAEIPALLRNGVTAQSAKNSVVILSAPATYLARSLALPTTRELVEVRVKTLVLVDTGKPVQDPAALRQVLANWPTPVVLCGREVGESLRFPGASIDKDFAWAPAHPVADVYRAFQPMPYDAPAWDLAAMLFAVHPDQFTLSDPGTITVRDDGQLQFAAAADGSHRSLRVDDAKKEAIVQTFVTMASAKPVPRVSPFRRQQQEQQKAPAAAPAAKPAEAKTENK